MVVCCERLANAVVQPCPKSMCINFKMLASSKDGIYFTLVYIQRLLMLLVWVAMMQLLTSLDVGAKFDSQFRELTYDIQGKKTLPVTDNGLLSVDIKGGYNFNPGSKQVCFKCLFHR
jgi:hypothetical protein